MSETIMADIQRSLGRIENKVDTALAWQRSHVEDDRAQFESVRSQIQDLSLAHAGQRGRAKVLSAIWLALSSALGAVVSAVLAHHK